MNFSFARYVWGINRYSIWPETFPSIFQEACSVHVDYRNYGRQCFEISSFIHKLRSLSIGVEPKVLVTCKI